MNRTRASLIAAGVLVSTFTACGKSGGSASPNVAEQKSSLSRDTAPAVPAADSTQLAADNRVFALDLYQQLRTQPGNLVYSPTSISLALAMTYNGAANGTATQMAGALHFTLPLPRLNAAFDAMDLALTAPPADGTAFQLSIANSLWTQKGFAVEQPFLDALATSYGAGVNTLDFIGAPEAARDEVNAWVSDQTRGEIPELFPDGTIDSNTRLVLADAVYFHGDWLSPFKPNSGSGAFHAPTGDVSVPMMSGAYVAIWSGAGWTAAALPYKGGTAQMVLVVPDAGTFDAFEEGLAADQLTAILSGQGTSGDLAMPRFKFRLAKDLNQTLSALGMPDAFQPGAADFSGIDGLTDLAIQHVVHQADIAVDEKGTTAAAATGVSIGTAGIELPSLTVDRPFLFFIVDQPTGAILFAGRVVDPSAT